MEELTKITEGALNRYFTALSQFGYKKDSELESLLVLLFIEDTILDVSAATGLTKIGCYGDSSHFMGGFKGLRVSDQAPFDSATAPQIDVSYTGMDRNALVQLFQDLPYNVGYTVVGSPMISNGVVSGFSANDYLSLPATGTEGCSNAEVVIRIKVNSTTSTVHQIFFGTSGNTGASGAGSLTIGRSVNPSTAAGAINMFGTGNWPPVQSPFYVQENTWYDVKATWNGSVYNLYAKLATDENYTSITSYAQQLFIWNNIYLGRAQTNTNEIFNGSIDLNNTTIKINGEYWFKGQPDMTKTLSCVGATGTVDLTQDDKDIALNKGWSLTLS
jgi:hypothetical protein